MQVTLAPNKGVTCTLARIPFMTNEESPVLHNALIIPGGEGVGDKE